MFLLLHRLAGVNWFSKWKRTHFHLRWFIVENHRVTMLDCQYKAYQTVLSYFKIGLLTWHEKAEGLGSDGRRRIEIRPWRGLGYWSQLISHWGSHITSKFSMDSVCMCVLKAFSKTLDLGMLKSHVQQHFLLKNIYFAKVAPLRFQFRVYLILRKH